MDSSTKTGLMAVCAVSGSVVFVAMQVHKRLLSRFMERMELEITSPTETEMEMEMQMKEEPKKKVRFADDVAEPSGNQKGGGRTAASGKANDENLEALPENWQAMYKEILHQRHNLRTCN